MDVSFSILVVACLRPQSTGHSVGRYIEMKEKSQPNKIRKRRNNQDVAIAPPNVGKAGFWF